MPKSHKSKTHKHDEEIVVKSDNQMNENAVDMNIKYFVVDNSNATQSNHITEKFGNQSH